MAENGSTQSDLGAQPRRVLVSEVNWLGDLVMSLPALRAVRRAYPGSVLGVLVREELASFFERAKFVDEVLVRKRTRGWRDLVARQRIVAEIRRRRFDLAILFPNSFDAALIAAIARVPKRAGFACDGRGLLLTHKARPSPDLGSKHQVYYWLEMLRATLNIDGDPSDWALETDDAQRAGIEPWLAQRRRADTLIALAPAAAYGPAKEWPESYYVALINLLAERYVAQSVLLGSAAERRKCERIANASRHEAIIAAGETDLSQLMGLVSLCNGFAGNDSGTMHLAAALGIPTVGIFGSTDPMRTGPLGPRVGTIYHRLECSPCLDRTCRFGHYNCLREILPVEVAETLRNLGALN